MYASVSSRRGEFQQVHVSIGCTNGLSHVSLRINKLLSLYKHVGLPLQATRPPYLSVRPHSLL